MFARFHASPARLTFGLFIACSLLAGCGRVQEDRTVAWSPKGNRVAFQHGAEGFFVADREGQGLKSIYKPDAKTIAVGTPQWAPDGKRLIFATARRAESSPATSPQAGGVAAEKLFQAPFVYECWIRDESRGDRPPEPRKLFEAGCNDPSYVAANLAVRFSPAGDAVIYIDSVAPSRQTVFEFRLDDGARRQVFPYTAEEIVFEWSPNGDHLACAATDVDGTTSWRNGVWLGRLYEDDWRHVPMSESLAQARLKSPIERLRATLPVWAHDGATFAFVSGNDDAGEGSPTLARLWMGNNQTSGVELLAEFDQPLADLAWSPDDSQLGAVRGGESLVLINRQGETLPSITDRPVQRFVGWSANGELLAYVAPQRESAKEHWALLMSASGLDRHGVFVASVDRIAPPQLLAADLNVTFPRWSPTENKLSLWFTFTPTYRSWQSERLGWSLQPGDPAALVDVATGRIDWLATTPFEMTQVGHYLLLKRQYAEAWQWYERARAAGAPAVAAMTLEQALRQVRSPPDASFFESICLLKLGRRDEALEKQRLFRERFPPRLSEVSAEALAAGSEADRREFQRLKDILAPERLSHSLVQNLYVLEACLAVDAADLAESYFRERLDGEDKDVRLSAAIGLAQCLLLQGRHQDFVDLAVERGGMLLLATCRPEEIESAAIFADGSRDQGLALAVLPLFSQTFLKTVDDACVERAAAAVEALRASVSEEKKRNVLETFLLVAYERLGKPEKQAAVMQGKALSPDAVRTRIDEADRKIFEWRQMIEALRQLREAFGAF